MAVAAITLPSSSSSSSSSSLGFFLSSFTNYPLIPTSMLSPPPHSSSALLIKKVGRQLVLRVEAATNTHSHRSTRSDNRVARHERIRKKVEGTEERPRMSVFRSNNHLYVQVIDDTKMHTLASASTMQKNISQQHASLVDYSSKPTIEIAKKIGLAIAAACLEKGITKVVFDRGGYPYHGRIEALANAAREGGLDF